MYIELCILASGVPAGLAIRTNPTASKLTSWALMGTIYALLLTMGASLGQNEKLFMALGSLGLQGITLGILCTLGSAIVVSFAGRLFKAEKEEVKQEKQTTSTLKSMSGSLYILGAFCVGLVCGRLGLWPEFLDTEALSVYILWVMLFCVGITMGLDLKSLLIVREMGLRVILVPVLASVGCFAGAVLAVFITNISVAEAMTGGAAFGYYSLSSVVATQMVSPALGSLTLIANVTRELFTLLATPLMVRFLGPLAPVAAAGAPGMDTCLPVIIRFTDDRYGIISIFNGLVMTILVPFLVPAVISIFY